MSHDKIIEEKNYDAISSNMAFRLTKPNVNLPQHIWRAIHKAIERGSFRTNIVTLTQSEREVLEFY